jgi:glycerate-2-kinase
MIIQNSCELLSHGNVPARRAVLDVLEAGLAAPDPYANVRRVVRIEGSTLIVGDPALSDPPGAAPLTIQLKDVPNIYVIGGGKVAQREAEALEDVLGDRITEGHINAKKGDTVRLKRINVTLAGHPLPDEDSVVGARRIVEIARRARPGDIVFHCHSGGATALTALPAPGISLADLQTVYRLLYFECGVSMPVANAVRNQLVVLHSRLARFTDGATVIHLITQETPQGLRVHPYQAEQQDGGYAAAQEVLRTHGLWDRVPDSVRTYLQKADPEYGHLRPEETAGKPHHYFRVMGPETMLQAAKKRSEELGIPTFILASSLNDVEARPIGEAFGHMAAEIERLSQPVPAPCMLICGGELLVRVGEATGSGGRNQEFVLAAATRIAGSPNIVVASADSEGGDGPTDAAGGIVDGLTIERANAIGSDVVAELDNHNSYGCLLAVGDLIHTGVRGTNVRDLRLIYVAGSTPPVWIPHGP